MATTIKMPQLGESVTEGTIERWLVKEGDSVEQYDPLFEVVTDKVNAEVPAEIGGTVTKILIPDGETVAVGTAVAEIDADGAGAAAADAPAAEAAPAPAEPAAEAPQAESDAAAPAEPAEGNPAEPAPVAESEPPAAASVADDGSAEMEQGPTASAAPEPPATPAPAPTATPAPSPGTADADGAARMTPAVRRLVREHGIDIAALHGSGAGGRVTRDDVLAFIEKGAAAPAAAAEPAAPQA